MRIWLDVFAYYTEHPDPRAKLLVSLKFIHVIQANYECIYLGIYSTRPYTMSEIARLRSISPLSNLSETLTSFSLLIMDDHGCFWKRLLDIGSCRRLDHDFMHSKSTR